VLPNAILYLRVRRYTLSNRRELARMSIDCHGLETKALPGQRVFHTHRGQDNEKVIQVHL
jgi:hypothetical protein